VRAFFAGTPTLESGKDPAPIRDDLPGARRRRQRTRRTVDGVDLVVETHDLTKRFGERTAVDGVELRIPRGAAFGYLGPNGAGKTTLIRMLLGLTAASAGSMRLLGLAVPERRRRRARRRCLPPDRRVSRRRRARGAGT
jgi:ABC-type glutathione transport system ATPase component